MMRIPGPMVVHQGRFMFQDQIDAMAYWADKEWKKWAVDITAGPEKKPTFCRTFYCAAMSSDRALEVVKRDLTTRPPRGARYVVRLAGPRELGCVPVSNYAPADAAQPVAPTALFVPSADAQAQAAKRTGSAQILTHKDFKTKLAESTQ